MAYWKHCLLLLLGIIIDGYFELYTHVKKKLIDENYIENYIFIENIVKIWKACITSDTENLDGVTHLIESIIQQRKSQGLPKYQKQRIILIQQALGLWNASMEKWNRFGYQLKKVFCDNETYL